MAKTYKSYGKKRTSQQMAIPGRNMVKNDAGGYVFPVDEWVQLDRFLIQGSESNTYYVKAQELTEKNAENVIKCIRSDGKRTVDRIVEISQAGRAPKNDPALFALALCSTPDIASEDTRRHALDMLPLVARTGTHLLHFADYMDNMRGWGRMVTRAYRSWFTGRKPSQLAYQLVKYRSRDGWAQRDILRKAHFAPPDQVYDDILEWVVGGWDDAKFGNPPEWVDDAPMIYAYEAAQRAKDEQEIISLISAYKLPWEALPTEYLRSREVWALLLAQSLPLHATLRNLGRMGNLELLTPGSTAEAMIVERLTDADYIKKSRLHPVTIMIGMSTYAQGVGFRGKMSWKPTPKIVKAGDVAFELAFGNVEPTGKNTVIGVDVSGSMGGYILNSFITAREAAAAMMLVTAKVEQNYTIIAFSHRTHVLEITPNENFRSVIKKISNLRFGQTDCSLPMQWATKNNVPAEGFMVYTDNETWYGNMHPSQALQRHRNKMGVPAKMVVSAFDAYDFSIADPKDAGMLDVVGFDANTPQIISDFIADRI